MNPTTTNEQLSPWPWQVSDSKISFDTAAMATALKDFSRACYLVNDSDLGVGIATEASLMTNKIGRAHV